MRRLTKGGVTMIAPRRVRQTREMAPVIHERDETPRSEIRPCYSCQRMVRVDHCEETCRRARRVDLSVVRRREREAANG